MRTEAKPVRTNQSFVFFFFILMGIVFCVSENDRQML